MDFIFDILVIFGDISLFLDHIVFRPRVVLFQILLRMVFKNYLVKYSVSN